MIELRGLTAGYGGTPVLHDVALSFPTGQVTVLVGPNGCGKSTLLKAALGLIPVGEGQVFYDGAALETLSPAERAQKAAYMAQSRPVPNITARRLVLHGRFPYLSFPRRYRREDTEQAEAALRQADAAELADRLVTELSGGQRQKVYLAMALAQDTPAVFMDEPTTYLDIRHQLEVMKTARRLADEEQKAVVLVLHDLCLAMQAADRIALLEGGRLILVGTPEEVYGSGALDRVFHIHLRRLSTPGGYRYYYE